MLWIALPRLTGLLLAWVVLANTKKWRFSTPETFGPVTSPPSDLAAPAVSILESRDSNANTCLAVVAEAGQKGIMVVDVEGSYLGSATVIVGMKHIKVGYTRYKLEWNGSPQTTWESRLSDSANYVIYLEVS